MDNIFTTQDYIQPEWGTEPQHKYYFQVIKDGCLLGKVDIRQKSFNLVGRLEDLCDIYIDNQTVSRKHAIIQSKKQDHCLYIYDLGSSHGTFVNKQKLPMRTFKRLSPFDNIKFGVSSRIYVMRCPQYEQIIQNEELEKNNTFSEVIKSEHKQISKQELKQKYLDMLQNDPYFAANNQQRTLIGRQKVEEDEYEGINWGMTDDREVYASNHSQFPIQPDILRRLNLDSIQLNKLSQYQDNMRIYTQIESQLNDLTSKEKKQFGLEQKMQNKKQKLQKRFVEALQAVEKLQDWLRFSIFGQKIQRDTRNIIKIKQKQTDTFGEDEFYDRTLQKKEEIKAENNFLTTQDFWKLQKQLKQHQQNLQQLEKKLSLLCNQTQQNHKQQQDQDELQKFMKNNQLDLKSSNIEILNREIEETKVKINVIKQKFQKVLGKVEMDKIDLIKSSNMRKSIQQEFQKKSKEENLNYLKRKQQQDESLQKILDNIQQLQEDQQEIDELDPAIFKFYKPLAQAQQNDDEDDQDFDYKKYVNKNRDRPEASQYQNSIKKHKNIDSSQSNLIGFEENEVIDITKTFK